MKIRHFLLFALLCGAILFSSCKSGGSSYFSYRVTAFEAEICIERNGAEYSALVTYAPKAAGGVLSVRYLSPASLAGICVTREANGTVYATLGDIRAEMTERTAAGLLSPASALFSDAALLSVQTTEVSGQKMTLLTLEDGIAITLSASGIPTKLQTDAFYMEIVWWVCKNFVAEE